MSIVKKTCVGKAFHFLLNDYISAEGICEYEKIGQLMEEKLRLGYHVLLFSSSSLRKIILIGFPEHKSRIKDFPWWGDFEVYKNPIDGIVGQNGKLITDW